MRVLIGLLLAGVAAYAFSFAVDLLLGGLLGVYPTTAFLPVVTWSLLSVVTSLGALRAAPSHRLLVLPYVAFALLAILGGIIGHRYSLGVAAAMVLQAAGVWKAVARTGRPRV